MADITMCSNSEECQLRKNCYRVNAKKGDPWQAYKDFFEPDEKCEDFVRTGY